MEPSPLKSQTAGHSMMLQLPGVVLKQMNARELQFYANAPHFYPELLEFLPVFYGVIRLNHDIDDEAKQLALSTLPNERRTVSNSCSMSYLLSISSSSTC